MAEFLTTHEIASSIEKIIRQAKEEIIILSPYLQLSQSFFDRLQDADRKKVKITIIYRNNAVEHEQDKNARQMNMLSELKYLNLRCLHNLHAKCYLNEELMVITSMNMYEYSEKNNREMGVLVSKDNDTDIFNKAREEALSIVHKSTEIQRDKKIPSYDSVSESKWHSKTNNGFCIRCGRQINYNTYKPYCQGCYEIWAEYENPFYIESYCHRCSKPANTSIDKPLCSSCFQST